MQQFEDDSWADKVMVFLSNNIFSVSEEWFRLVEWFFLVSALSFGAQQLGAWWLDLLSVISMVVLYLRCLVGYYAKLHAWFAWKYGESIDGPGRDRRTAKLWWPLALGVSFLGFLIWELAMLFASELSVILNQ